MKKIYFIFIFLLNMLFTIGLIIQPSAASSNEDVAKPLICQRGIDYTRHLQYDGYTIESSNVNFNISGRYLVKYINDSTDETIYKFIYVEDMSALKNNNCYSEKYSTLYNMKENEKVSLVKQLSDGSYIYLYSEEILDSDEFYNFYITKVKDNEIIFNSVIAKEVRGKITEVIEVGTDLCVLADFANGTSYLDINLYIFDSAGSRKVIKTFSGNGVDQSVNLLSDDNYLYIVGTTLSNDGIYSFYHDYKSGFTIVLDKNTYEQVGLYSIVVNNDLNVKDACIKDNMLYIVIEYFHSSILSMINEIYVFDNSSLSFSEKRYIASKGGETFTALETYNDKIYFVIREYDYDTKLYFTRLYTYTLNGGRKLIYEYTYTKNGNATFVDLIITEDDTLVMLYNLINVSNNYDYGYLYHIVKGKDIVCEIENYSTNCATYGLLNPNKIWLKDKNAIYLNDIVYASLSHYNEEIKAEFDSDLKLPYVYMDGKLIKASYRKSNIEYNPKIFGEYNASYFFEGTSQDIAIEGKIIVESYTNVYDGGIFDKGIIINFNGEGNLNNLVIESGYKIERTGSYTLKLVGMNEVETINFEVRDLSHQESLLSSENISFEQTININDVTSSEVNVLTNINENNIPDKEIDYQGWYVLIPMCAVIVMVITFIKKRG